MHLISESYEPTLGTCFCICVNFLTLSLICFVLFCSMFFCDRLAGDSSGGNDVLQGTPLRMPNNPDYKSFRKILSHLPDVDAPYFFCLPDNIERSLQRTNSAILIKQLRILSSSNTEGSKYDRDIWRAQLGPVLDLWQQLTSTAPGVISKKLNRETSSHMSKNATGVGAEGKNVVKTDPVEDFILMECEMAGENCGIVDASLSALKKVCNGHLDYFGLSF